MTSPRPVPPPDLPPTLPKKQERLLIRIEKAGVRASQRSGHLVSREELLDLKVQVAPPGLRIATGVLVLAAAAGSYACWTAGAMGWTIGLALLALLLLGFVVFGVRRTLRNIVDGLDAVISSDLISLALEGISALISSAADGS